MFEAIAAFVAKQIAGYASKKGLEKLFGNKKTFEKCLATVINQSIEEYHQKYPIADSGGKFGFYQSQILLEELLKLRFFGNVASELDPKALIAGLKQNPNILLPGKQQLEDFLEIFEKYRKADPELKKAEIEENYQEQVFHNTDKLDRILQLLEGLINPPGSLPKELTSVPRTPRNKIVGRDEELRSLRDSLLQNQETVLVNGMGGIGKTTLAEVYAHTFYDEYDHLAWLTLESGLEEAIAANSALLKNLNLLQTPPNEQVNACLNVLRTLQSEQPLLLIIDNATSNLASHFETLPKPPNCHLLVTSREQIEPFHIIELNFLTKKDAIALFRKQNNAFTDDEIANIVKEVEYHTLTIEVLAKSAQKTPLEFRTNFGCHCAGCQRRRGYPAQRSPKDSPH